MKLKVKIGGITREVEATRAGARLRWQLDGQAVDADAVEVEAGTYSILLEGRAFEIRVHATGESLRIETPGKEFFAAIENPRRWKGRRGHVPEMEDRQQVVAPMPGKVVGVLVKKGDAVQAGQGIVVVEAMKMLNEVRSRKSGTVERLLTSEGKTVNAGEIVAVVA